MELHDCICVKTPYINYALRRMYSKECLRSEAIEQDLGFYYKEWRSLPTSKVAKAYESHIRSISDNNPIQLLAYGYTMYLALLSGGQVVRRKVVKAFTLFKDSENGINMFDFIGMNPIELKRLRLDWKSKFNDLELPSQADDDIIHEVGFTLSLESRKRCC